MPEPYVTNFMQMHERPDVSCHRCSLAEMLFVMFIAEVDNLQRSANCTNFVLTSTLCAAQLEVRTLAALTQVKSPAANIPAQVSLNHVLQRGNTCSKSFPVDQSSSLAETKHLRILRTYCT
jgi:hypothetical protein